MTAESLLESRTALRVGFSDASALQRLTTLSWSIRLAIARPPSGKHPVAGCPAHRACFRTSQATSGALRDATGCLKRWPVVKRNRPDFVGGWLGGVETCQRHATLSRAKVSGMKDQPDIVARLRAYTQHDRPVRSEER